MKIELQRKEALISKHHERLQQWQGLLSRTGSQAQGHAQQPQGQGPVPQGQGMVPQGQIHTGMNNQPMPPPPTQGSFPQGPLAYLEQTTSNIGMPERR